jgi:hypothetical protein
MKSFVATIEIKNRFRENNLETIWILAKNRSHAIYKARIICKDYEAKFISIRLVK